MPTDRETWDKAVAAATAAHGLLNSEQQFELQRLLADIMAAKRALVALVNDAGSGAICCECGGECCLRGKYHFSVLDALAYHVTGTEPVIPDFTRHPACPYSGDRGCLMTPAYRPFTCVVFNCDPVEDLLDTAAQQAYAEHEARLRRMIRTAGAIGTARFDRPLLLSLE